MKKYFLVRLRKAWRLFEFRYAVSIGVLLCVFASTVGCGGATSQASTSKGKKATEKEPKSVHVAEITQMDVQREVTLVGTVTAIRRSVIGSPVEGRVVGVFVDRGDHVSFQPSDGQKIAQLSTEIIDIEVRAATAELERLQQRLNELVAGLRPEEIAQAKAQLDSAQAAKQYADARKKRFRPLQETSVVSKEEFEAIQSAALAAEQNVIAAQAKYELAKLGTRKELIAQAKADVDGQTQQLRRLEVQQAYHTIRAPFEGFVVERLAEVGQWLSRGTPVAEVVALDPIDIEVQVPESLVAQLRIGSDVSLRVDALGPENSQLTGKLHGIVPSANRQGRTFPVRIRVENPKQDQAYLLKDGMQARAVILGSLHPALFVPKDALTLGESDPRLMVGRTNAEGKMIATAVPVTIGRSKGNHIEVNGDIKVGELVITDGNERVQSGDPLTVLEE